MSVQDDLVLTTGRLEPKIFQIPVNDIRIGYRSAVYFNRTQAIMVGEDPNLEVTMQVFQKNNAVLCGMDEALAILKLCAGHFTNHQTVEHLFYRLRMERQNVREVVSGQHSPHGGHTIVDELKAEKAYEQALVKTARTEADIEKNWVSRWDELYVHALCDGDEIKPWEAVMTITGPYAAFAHLESVYLGILARQTRIATNTSRVTKAAHPKPVLFFADRFDHYATQGGDGYAAKVGGATGFASDAMVSWWGDKASGTMPHALIAAYSADVVAASEIFHKYFPDTGLIALVDFNNDCVGDAVRCVRRFGDELWGVRLDTSERMVDHCLGENDMGEVALTGVNATLVHKVRAALDSNGGQHVKIVVSGGFTAEKITAFEAEGVPADVYAVGSSLLHGSNDFTADVVSPVAKKGRWPRPTNRLQRVD